MDAADRKKAVADNPICKFYCRYQCNKKKKYDSCCHKTRQVCLSKWHIRGPKKALCVQDFPPDTYYVPPVERIEEE